MDTLLARAKKIKLLILDIDGVCTDGRLYFSDHGETLKVFHAHDGLGIKMLQKTGVEVAIISARLSPAVNDRMQSLGVQHIHQGQKNKLVAYELLLAQLQIQPEAVAYVGDDLPDLPVLRRVGLSIGVKNATPLILSQVNWVTTKKGGHGAVREVCDFIMQAQDTLDQALSLEGFNG